MTRRAIIAYALAATALVSASVVRAALVGEPGPVDTRSPGPSPQPPPDAGGLGAFSCLGDILGELGTDTSDQAKDIESQVEIIGESVERIRELGFDQPVEPSFLSPGAMTSRIGELFHEDYTAGEADVEGRALEALGAIPPGTDMRALRLSALTGQVAGFYVPETAELVVQESGAGELLSGLEKVVLSHELEHALAHQVLGFPVDDEAEPLEEDSELAALAVVEGDATLTMQRFGATLSLSDQVSLLADPSILQAEVDAADLPHYLEQELTFPYLDGTNLVCERFGEGGWAAVNDMYARPPDTTLEVMFPELFGQVQPLDPGDPGSPGTPWTRARAGRFGAANLLWLLEAPGGDAARALDNVRDRVTGWGGGELNLWTSDEETALGLALAQGDGPPLCETITAWYGAAFPDADRSEQGSATSFDDPTQDAVVSCSDREVRVGIAPDPQTALALIG